MVFQECLKGVRGFKGALRKFQGCCKKDSRVFQGSFNDVLRKCRGYLKKGSIVFKEIKIKIIVSRVFKNVSIKFCSCMDLIAATRAEGGLV